MSNLSSMNCLTGVIAAIAMSYPLSAQAQESQDTADLSVEIKNRLYKTRHAFDIGAHGGQILNHPYIKPWAVNGTATYFFSRSFGVGLDYTHIFNQDKSERICVENFYNVFNHSNIQIRNVCAEDGNPDTAKKDLEPFKDLPNAPNMGPAYPPIRELSMIIQGTVVWAPIYGKLLLFMSQVVHFSSFMILGGGVTMNKWYSDKPRSSKGKLLRGPAPLKGSKSDLPGALTTEVNEYGEAGRPTPKDLVTPTISFGIGQKFYFTENINIHLEGRSMLLIGTEESGNDIYFALWAGLGLRI